jgi:ATP-dependent Clp protease ATP-binding subunit ClpC
MHDTNKDKVHDALKKMMRPELLNRIDKIVVFRSLAKKDLHKILDLQIEELRKRLAKQGLGVELTNKAKDYLLDHGYDAKNGVRPLRRLLQDTLEDHIALQLLENSYQTGDVVKVSVKDDELQYEVVTE